MHNSNVAMRLMAISLSIGLALGMVAGLHGWVQHASAATPEPISGSDRYSAGDVAGVASDAIACLQIGSESSGPTVGVVRLNWEGQAERARLVIRVAGAEAAHSLKINGRRVAHIPVYAEGSTCDDGRYVYVDIPVDAVVQGDNAIELTNDSMPEDSWTASHIRLEVRGALNTQSPDRPGALATTQAVSEIITFVNSYDGSMQEAIVQRPAGYSNSGSPRPLLVALHGRTGVMEQPLNDFGVTAEARGWLLASPQMHGRWPPPGYNCSPSCQWYDIPPSPPGSFAYASLESQYDVIGTVKYMVQNYNVKLDQIYLVGYSMGGQIATVVAAKYPHLFAAMHDGKGPTDFAQWHGETSDFQFQLTMERECYTGSLSSPTPQPPNSNSFCYQRRSGLNFASNLIHVPISITHHISDTTVPISHSTRLRDAINSFGPDQPASVQVDTQSTGCGPNFHSCNPNPNDVLNFLALYTVNSLPQRILAITDESKSYYWLNLQQTGPQHWSDVRATYYPATTTVVATISDTQPMTLGVNLGMTPIVDVSGVSQPGLGLSATQYRITVGNSAPYTQSYSSGYLNVNVPAGQPVVVTISPGYAVYLPVVVKNP